MTTSISDAGLQLASGNIIDLRSTMPSTGSYTAGDFVIESTTGGRVSGWKRLTTGAGNVLGTDWVYFAAGATLGTAVATTSGTAIDFTSLPSWVKRITVMFNGVSTSGINGYRIQIGTTTPETSGYAGNSTVVANANVTATTPMAGAGFDTYSLAAAGLYHGQLTLIRMASNIWTFSAQLTSNETRLFSATGSKTTVGTIDILRITTIGSTDTFDAGSVNILYE